MRCISNVSNKRVIVKKKVRPFSDGKCVIRAETTNKLRNTKDREGACSNKQYFRPRDENIKNSVITIQYKDPISGYVINPLNKKKLSSYELDNIFNEWMSK